MKNKFKKNDFVKVICGKDKGKISTVISVLGNKLLIKNANLAVKHLKPKKENKEKGQKFKKEMPIHHSNVMHYSKDTQTVTRIGLKTHNDVHEAKIAQKSPNDIMK